MSTFKKSLILSFVQKYSELLIGFIASIILARLLMPEEVGLYSIVATIIVVAHMIRDFGVSSYIVQEDDLDDQKLISAFLVTCFWSYSIALILYTNSTNIAVFFNRNEIVSILNHVIINFLIIPFGSVSLSLLRKEMNFSALLKVNLISALFGAIVSVGMAFSGYSYMSLVWGSIATTAMTVLLSSFFRREISIVVPSLASIKNVFIFGSKSSYIHILFVSVAQLPEILIGKFFGMANVGLYSRANGLVKLFHMGVMQGIIPVLLPHLVNRMKEKGDVKAEYFKSIDFICTISWPFFIFLALMSEEIIETLYGVSWVSAAPLVIWLSLSAAVGSVYSINTHFFVAVKSIDLDVRNQSVSQIFSIIVMVVASFYGLYPLLFSIVISKIFSLLVSVYYLCKAINFQYSDILKNLRKAGVVSLTCFVFLYYVKSIAFLDSSNLFIQLSIIGALFSIVWIASLIIVKSEIINFFKKNDNV
ncbi:oligosaccharide flippase family protein [Neptunomonas japonica]|uniref:Polysaccharide biosynthesis protein n=1 Tax=Neptunomonas japonica JAMM 1380 TaxID=1441457 RepID=A0A7R6PQW3_9GAMM|nr:oligosaccharide flippase family protein [Neptunomonas japonica]BBB28760.1 polysaccharide biosynthesis protein [Neptunomonas japonica JAMM 1380]